MNKKILSLRLIIFASLILIVIYGIHLQNVNTLLNSSNDCQLINSRCSFSTNTFVLDINFVTPPTIEEELYIEFDISEKNQIKKAWVEGVNMYMGKTPVIFEKQASDNKKRGVTFLGSCSQSFMQWQLFIEITNDTEHTEVYAVSFTTDVTQN